MVSPHISPHPMLALTADWLAQSLLIMHRSLDHLSCNAGAVLETIMAKMDGVQGDRISVGMLPSAPFIAFITQLQHKRDLEDTPKLMMMRLCVDCNGRQLSVLVRKSVSSNSSLYHPVLRRSGNHESAQEVRRLCHWGLGC